MPRLSLLKAILFATFWAPSGIAQTPATPEAGQWVALADVPDCEVWNPMPNPNLESSVLWSGDCVNGKAEGPGTLLWRSQSDQLDEVDRYEGGMRQGRFHGEGLLISAIGTVRGNFVDGFMYGHGTLAMSNGYRFEGAFERNRRHGVGVASLPNGDTCEAKFVDGLQVNPGHGVSSGLEMTCRIVALGIEFPY